MENQYSVLRLFGGKKKVMERAKKTVQKAIGNLTLRELKILEETLFLQQEQLLKIYGKREKLTGNLFTKISSSLSISLFTALGKPNYINQRIKKYWLKDMERKPLSTPKQYSLDKQLELHVSLKGIEALDKVA